MAEHDQQDRTEEATLKRREEARRKGQVPRSMELNAAAVLVATAAMLQLGGETLGGGFAELLRRGLAFDRRLLDDELAAIGTLRSLAFEALVVLAPVLAVGVLAALLAPLLIGGWNFSIEALGFKGERISPLAGLRRMFSGRSLFELAKAFVKFGLVASCAVGLVALQFPQIQRLGAVAVEQGIRGAFALSVEALLVLACALVLIAAIDVPYQLWQHRRELRMTRQELRDEGRETEGSPEVRGRIRSMQQAMARRRMMAEVPRADVIVTNPTHFAVALRYEERSMRAPTVVAKGADEVARRIREIGLEHQVPLVEAPPLARVLYRGVDLGAQIPAALYAAVAQVLTYVFQLRTARERGLGLPAPPAIDPSVEQLDLRAER